MTLSRILAACAALCATPAFAATVPFTVGAEDSPRGVILVTNSGAGCAANAATATALAAQAGRAIGVVAETSGCAAAEMMMTLDAAPALAFAADARALGPAGEPNAFLARNRADGVYVWSMEAYRRLALPASRQVLGVFEGESQAALIGAALERLSQQEEGYFLLVQAQSLDAATIHALEAARADGATVIAPALIHNTGLID
jgi:hypothetical protein